MHDDDSEPHPAPIVPLPRRLPATAMTRLVADALGLAAIAVEAPGAGPTATLLSYRRRGDDRTAVAWESWRAGRDDARRAVFARIEEGLRFALPVHGGWRSDGVPLIDGRAAAAEALGPAEPTVLWKPADGVGHGRSSPQKYFALGLARDGDGIALEQILVEIPHRGGVRVRLAVFPEVLRRRVAAYLLRLE